MTSRTKEENSFRKKLDGKKGKYTSLGDITDIVGIKIITHFHDDVDAVSSLIRREFQIDEINSVDKRYPMVVTESGKAVNQFGYQSLHLVVSLLDARCQLTEYKPFSAYKCEIQIRSILQHAGAEIEHDLGYKPDTTLSAELSRRFASLSALLEMADREFAAIRDKQADDEIQKLSAAASSSYPEELNVSGTNTILVDSNTLLSFIRDNSDVQSLDTEIVNIRSAALVPDDDVYSQLVSYLEYVGLDTIQSVQQQLSNQHGLILKLASVWPAHYNAEAELPYGICLYYLVFAIVLSDDAYDLETFLQELGVLANTLSSTPNRLADYLDLEGSDIAQVVQELTSARTTITTPT